MEKQGFALLAVSGALVVLAAALAAVVLADGSRVGGFPTTQENTVPEDVISVTGQAQTTVTPDVLTILLTVEKRASTPSEALARLTESANNVVKTLVDFGLKPEDIKTVSLNIYPEYAYREGQPPEIVRYVATYVLEVKTRRLADGGSIIEKAINAGADYISGVYFSLSREKSEEIYRQLLSAAVTDASVKAEAVLSPLGLKTVRVKSVSISESAQPVFRAAAEASSGGPSIMPGTTTVSVTVNIVYVIGPR
jgi:uncharacterized protein YggE